MLHKGTKILIAELLRKTGHVFAIADLDDVATLDRLQREVISPDAGTHCDLYAAPVHIGVFKFTRLTYGKTDWHDNTLLKWWPNDPVRCFIALAYAMTRPNTKASIDRLHDKKTLSREMAKFARRLHIPLDELQERLKVLLPSFDEAPADPERAEAVEKYGPGIMRLCDAFPGTTPAHWYFTATDFEVAEAIAHINRKARAENPDIPGGEMTPKDYAILAQKQFLKDLEARWTAGAGNNLEMVG